MLTLVLHNKMSTAGSHVTNPTPLTHPVPTNSTSLYANGYSSQTPYGADLGFSSSFNVAQSSRECISLAFCAGQSHLDPETTDNLEIQRHYLQQLLASGNPPAWLLSAIQAAQDPATFMQAFTQGQAPPAPPTAPPAAFGIDPALLRAPPPHVAPASPPAPFGIDPALLGAPPARVPPPPPAAPPPAFGVNPALLRAGPRPVVSVPVTPALSVTAPATPDPAPAPVPVPNADNADETMVRGGSTDNAASADALPTNIADKDGVDPDPYEMLTDAEETAEDFDEAADGSFVPRTDIKGRHVSALNAKHGLVKGVGRGKRKWGQSSIFLDFGVHEVLTNDSLQLSRARLNQAQYLRISAMQLVHIMRCCALCSQRCVHVSAPDRNALSDILISP